jgi:hypothetical protein
MHVDESIDAFIFEKAERAKVAIRALAGRGDAAEEQRQPIWT